CGQEHRPSIVVIPPALAEQTPNSSCLLRASGESRPSPSSNALGLITSHDCGGAVKLATASVTNTMLDPRNRRAPRPDRHPSSSSLVPVSSASPGPEANLPPRTHMLPP